MKVIEDNKIYGGPNNSLSYHRVELLLDSNADLDNAIYALICAGNLKDKNDIIGEAKYKSRIEKGIELLMKLVTNEDKSTAIRASSKDGFPGISDMRADETKHKTITMDFVQSYDYE